MHQGDMTAHHLLFGIPFSAVDQDQLLRELLAPVEKGQGARLVVTANVDHIVQLRRNPALRAAYAHAWRRTIDGTPVHLYAGLRGMALPKVAGSDLFPAAMRHIDPKRHRPFFVCADDIIARTLRDTLVKRGFSPDAVGTVVPPFRFEQDDSYSSNMAARIAAHGTTHLFFGVGCPKSEIWVDRHRHRLGDLYACAVGAALAFEAGTMSRAPRILRKVGLEWLYRALQEPQRLLKRYFVQSWSFLAVVKDDLFGSKVELLSPYLEQAQGADLRSA